MLSMAAQCAAMENYFPNLRCLMQLEWMAVWEGEICPLQQRYKIRVEYIVAGAFGDARPRQPNPRVTVLEPLLQRRPDQAKIPHTYTNPTQPALPELCLEFHHDHEWTPDMPVATSTIPWASQWLADYEGWRWSGIWRGDGLHPGDEEYQKWEEEERGNDFAQTPAQQARGIVRGRSFLGLRLRRSVSLASMAAVLRAYMQRPSSRKLKAA